MLQTPDIQALLSECSFSAVRSSGKGGQNVNKVSTKVILVFDVVNSVVLSDEQKAWLLEKLMARISNEGLLLMNASSERTQLGNRKKVEEKFTHLIIKAFHIPVKRVATRPTAGSRERRLRDKKSVGVKKASRGNDFSDLSMDG
jgi:ribosome-associated protein